MDRKQAFRAFTDSIRHDDHARFVELAVSEPEHLKMTTPFGTWLHVAASHGRMETVRYLVESGVDVNARGGVANGTPLHDAASEGHLDVIDYLFRKGAILDTSEPSCNPLFAAIYGGHVDVAKYVIENGLDPTIRYSGDNMDNMDALAFAQERGQSQFFVLLS